MKHNVQTDNISSNSVNDDQTAMENDEFQEELTELKKNLKDKEEDVDSWARLFLQEKKSNEKLQSDVEDLQKKNAELEKIPKETNEDFGAFTKLWLDEKKKSDAIQKEKDDLQKKILQLEKNLKAKQAVDLDKDVMEELNQALTVKHRMINDELQEARKEMIDALEDTPTGRCRTIGVKRMGVIDTEPFLRAMKKTYNATKAREKAATECSLWEKCLRNSKWQPFKTITIDGIEQEVIDPEDEKLKDVKEDLGNEVYGAIVTATMEMNEYNPSGRYPIPELWNYGEGRKATLKEGVSYLLSLDYQKRRKMA